MCSYLLTDNTEEFVNCYDPALNKGKYATNARTACWENVDVDDGHGTGQTMTGKFCVCDGKNDLCNEDFFIHKPENGASVVVINIAFFVLICLQFV